jgi:hypothetical protein
MESPKLNTEINLTHTDRKISLVSISEGGRRFLVVEKDNISSTIRLFQKQENDIVNKSQSVLDKPIHDIDINYDGQLVAVVYKEGHLNSTGIVLLDENLTQTGFIETERTPYKISFGDDNYLTAIFNDNQEIKRYSTTVEPIILPFKSDYPVSLFDYCDNVFIMVNIYSEIILVNIYNPDNSFNLTFGGNDYYLYSTIDGVFTASHKDMVRGVQWLDIVPQSEWVDLYDYDEIEGRLVEYMGLVSDW